MSLKKDRKRTGKIVLPARMKGKVDRTRYDISGYDTKGQKRMKGRKVYTGPRGGKYIMRKGEKRYLV